MGITKKKPWVCAAARICIRLDEVAASSQGKPCLKNQLGKLGCCGWRDEEQPAVSGSGEKEEEEENVRMRFAAAAEEPQCKHCHPCQGSAWEIHLVGSETHRRASCWDWAIVWLRKRRGKNSSLGHNNGLTVPRCFWALTHGWEFPVPSNAFQFVLMINGGLFLRLGDDFSWYFPVKPNL